MSTRPAFLILLAALAACAPAATTGGASHDRARVTHEELLATHATDLYTALRQLRPEFFASRGVSSIRLGTEDIPDVYVDRVLLGNIEALRDIAVINVVEVRRLTSTESTIRLGRDSPAGAILVTTTSGNR